VDPLPAPAATGVARGVGSAVGKQIFALALASIHGSGELDSCGSHGLSKLQYISSSTRLGA
jgi:hypothetical protein